jgi:tRNA splicing ligase
MSHPKRGKTQTDSSLQNLRPGGTIQRHVRSIAMGRLRNPVSNSDISDDRGGPSDPLKKANGTVVFVAILQELKEPTVVALKVGEGMSKDEAKQYEKDLNKTLKEDPGLKQYGLTAEGLAKMVPHPSARLELVVRQSDDSLPE